MANVPESEKPAQSLDGATARSRTRSGAPRPERNMLLDSRVREALGMPRTDEVVERKYRVDRLLGMGGMGAVFAATHVVTGKRVALKWLLPGAADSHGAELRLLREAKATARIEHPNVVNVFDVGRHASGLYLVMELLEGESLGQRLQRARIEPKEAIALIMPALRGVSAAHAQGIVHRDLKPDNIFLCRDPQGGYRDSKVLDFGISKLTTGEELALTASGTLLGTPCYMSPEQIRGEGEVDERVDVYAVGVILYELLADTFPFTATHYNGLLLQIVMGEPVPLSERVPDLSSTLCGVVARAMAKDPAERFASIKALAKELEPFANGISFVPRISAPEPLLAGPAPSPVVATQREALQAWDEPGSVASAHPTPRGRRAALATIAESGRDSDWKARDHNHEVETDDGDQEIPAQTRTISGVTAVGRAPSVRVSYPGLASGARPGFRRRIGAWGRVALWICALGLLGLLAKELGPRRVVRGEGEPVAPTSPHATAAPEQAAPGEMLGKVPDQAAELGDAPEATTPGLARGLKPAASAAEARALPQRAQQDLATGERQVDSSSADGQASTAPPVPEPGGAQGAASASTTSASTAKNVAPAAGSSPPTGVDITEDEPATQAESEPSEESAETAAPAKPEREAPNTPPTLPPTLPENWDDRIRIPTNQDRAQSPAGPIRAEDL